MFFVFIKTHLDRSTTANQGYIMISTCWLTKYFFWSLGMWKWLDKTVMDYTNWDEDDENPQWSHWGCIITENGYWTSHNGWHDRPYICKKPKGKIVIPIDFY